MFLLFLRVFGASEIFCFASICLPEVCLLWQAGRKGNFLHNVPALVPSLSFWSTSTLLWNPFSVPCSLPTRGVGLCYLLWQSSLWPPAFQAEEYAERNNPTRHADWGTRSLTCWCLHTWCNSWRLNLKPWQQCLKKRSFLWRHSSHVFKQFS